MPARTASAVVAAVPKTRSCGSRPVSFPIVDLARGAEHRRKAECHDALEEPQHGECSGRRSFRNRCRDRARSAPARCPARTRARAQLVEKLQDRVDDVAVVRRRAWLCIATIGIPSSAAASSSSSARTPYRVDEVGAGVVGRARTAGLYVSTEIGAAGKRFAHARIAGTTRAISTSASTGRCPGRVDSPPTSSRSAPAAHCRSACAVGRSGRVFDPVAGERIRRDVDDAHRRRFARPIVERRAPHARSGASRTRRPAAARTSIRVRPRRRTSNRSRRRSRRSRRCAAPTVKASTGSSIARAPACRATRPSSQRARADPWRGARRRRTT